jgi:hypothetical protein
LLGYMLTWTTYGTWLQGEKKGWAKDGKVYRGNSALLEANKQLLKSQPVRLNKKHKQIVHDEINLTANRLGQEVLAVSVYSNHVHLVVNNIDKPAGIVAGIYKRDGTYALKKVDINGNVWTRGTDKRFCFDEKNLLALIAYVEGHADE